MNKFILLLTATILLSGCNKQISESNQTQSLAATVLAGSVIKSKHVDKIEKKYKRKDCPVCKGKGWYMSGDGIEKVSCGYCEPDQQTLIRRR